MGNNPSIHSLTNRQMKEKLSILKLNVSKVNKVKSYLYKDSNRIQTYSGALKYLNANYLWKTEDDESVSSDNQFPFASIKKSNSCTVETTGRVFNIKIKKYWPKRYRFIRNSKQLKKCFISYRHLKPRDDNASATVVCFHGVKMSSAQFGTLANYFRRLNIETIAFDQPGHGLSSEIYSNGKVECKLTGVVPPLEELIERNMNFLDILMRDRVIKMKRRDKSKKKLFLLGSSFGSAIVLNAIIKMKDSRYKKFADLVDGVIFICPPFKLVESVAIDSFTKWCLDQNAKFFPGLNFSPHPTWKNTSRLKEMEKISMEHPEYLRGQIPTLTVKTVLDIVEDNSKMFSKFGKPTLIIIGEDDDTADVKGAREFYEKIGSKDKTLRTYKNAKHRILEDLCVKEVSDDIVNWIQSHLSNTVIKIKDVKVVDKKQQK